MTIEQIYSDYTAQLKNVYQAREATTIADWVFENIAGIKRLDRITDKQKQIAPSTVEELKLKLTELLQHKPVQYILKEAWFYKMKFFVNHAVLIPRPETEELVEWILLELKMKNEKLKIIDVGTGSGCIAIALKNEFAKADIAAIDISAEALSVARQNASTLNTSIEFLQIDFLNESQWDHLAFFDIIVCNPPYISEKEKIKMQQNVVAYEPHLALFVSDDDKFIFYKKIASFAQSHLNKRGKIFVEINEENAKDVKEIFTQHGFTSTIKKDIYGRDRMISACR